MSKAVLMSIRPEWCDLIWSGRKTVEVRKTYPKLPDLPRPFKCYIYCSKEKSRLLDIVKDGDKLWGDDEVWHGSPIFVKSPDSRFMPLHMQQKVIAEFDCDIIEDLWSWSLLDYVQPLSGCTCLTRKEIAAYANRNPVYGWHISNLKKYEKPLTLQAFGLKRPPQSWAYTERLEG